MVYVNIALVVTIAGLEWYWRSCIQELSVIVILGQLRSDDSSPSFAGNTKPSPLDDRGWLSVSAQQ